jgi:outer membrane usher protein
MAMPMSRPWRWTARATSLAALLAALPLPARSAGAGELPGRADDAHAGPVVADRVAIDAEALEAGDEELYLAVSLNQSDTGRLARFVLRGGALSASSATLRALGLKWPGSEEATGLVPLSSLPGLQAVYDPARQRVSLVAPVAMLGSAPVRAGFVQRQAPRTNEAERVAGAILNYSGYGLRGGGVASLSMLGELRVFGAGPGTWNTSLGSRVASGAYADNGTTRLDSAWQLDMPERMLTLAVGDTITAATSWSRPLRIGGIRLARNFGLQPYRITAPMASFAGEAALPSTVDLFVDGLKQSSRDVPPGQFVFDSAPTLDGAGNARLVITDINGQRRVVEFAFYGTPQLLARGLSDWSVELGAVRHGYGETSFDYASRPMGSASIRYGWLDATTLEGHVEGDGRVQVAGAGVTQLLGSRAGVVGIAIAGSRNDDGIASTPDTGLQHSVAYQWSTRGFNFNLTSMRSDDGFRDLASLEGAAVARGTDQAYVGLSGLGGQWGLGWFRRIDRDGSRSGFASLGWSRQSDRAGYFSVQLNRRAGGSGGGGGGNHGVEASVMWTLPLGRVDSIAVRANRTSDGRLQGSAEVSRQLPGVGGGWGWRAQADSESGVQAQATYLGDYGQWTGGVNVPRGNAPTTAYGSVEGGLAVLQGHAFAMRRVDEAFALVSTHGVAGVPVRLSNNVVGHTDANGLLVVGRLIPWQDNKLSIDPLSLPAEMWIGQVEKSAVPAGRTGVRVAFDMHPVLSVQARVRGAAGEALPAGSAVWLLPADGAPLDPARDAPLTVIGEDSLLYLQDPPAHARLRVRHEGHYCEIVLPDVAQASGFADLGEVTCQ